MPELAFLDQALEHVHRRRHVLEALAEWHQRHGAADRRELALEVGNAPAIERQRLDVVEAVGVNSGQSTSASQDASPEWYNWFCQFDSGPPP